MPELTSWSETLPNVVHQTCSLTPISLLGIVCRPRRATGVNPLAGLTMLALAISGVIYWWKELWTRRLVLVSAFGFLAALEIYSPVRDLLYALVPLV